MANDTFDTKGRLCFREACDNRVKDDAAYCSESCRAAVEGTQATEEPMSQDEIVDSVCACMYPSGASPTQRIRIETAVKYTLSIVKENQDVLDWLAKR